jgi:hypothetical protein
MIPEAREVHLSREDRKVLEACCRSPVTLQRDLKRARMAAAGRSTPSIAKEVGVQPRIVSLWRHRYADHGKIIALWVLLSLLGPSSCQGDRLNSSMTGPVASLRGQPHKL